MAKKLRILHVTQRYLPALGGSELHLAALSARLVGRGHAVTVATTDALDFELFWDSRARRLTAREDVIDGVRVLRFPVRHLPVPRVSYPAWRRLLWLLTRTPFPPTPWVQRLARFTPWVPDLSAWLAHTEERFDVVGGMTIVFEPLIAAAQAFARRTGAPFVVYPLTHLGAGRAPGADPVSCFYTMRHQVELVRGAALVMAQTATEAQFYTGRGVPQRAITVAGPGVDPASLAGGQGERLRARLNIRGTLVAALSSMSYDKGTVHLMQAVRRLRARGEAVELVLAGSPTAEFRRVWESLSQEERAGIHLLGPVDEATKRDLLDALDIFALPSRTDSFGIAYLEAWLYAKPVIGAQVWGIADVIRHAQDGLLVPFGDVDALAEAIRTLARDPALAARLGEQGRRKTLAAHTWERKADLTEQAYLRLASAAGDA